MAKAKARTSYYVRHGRHDYSVVRNGVVVAKAKSHAQARRKLGKR
jgi:hypothetical protein